MTEARSRKLQGIDSYLAATDDNGVTVLHAKGCHAALAVELTVRQLISILFAIILKGGILVRAAIFARRQTPQTAQLCSSCVEARVAADVPIHDTAVVTHLTRGVTVFLMLVHIEQHQTGLVAKAIHIPLGTCGQIDIAVCHIGEQAVIYTHKAIIH